MTVVGLDPSYSRTGFSIQDAPDDYQVMSITRNANKECITEAMRHAFQIAAEIRPYLKEYDLDDVIIGVEYPIMATAAGSYLSLITSKLDSLFRGLKAPHVYYIPSIAIKAFTKADTKTELIAWVKQSGLFEKFKGNHDEASALVLGHIAKLAHEGKYKKSFYHVDYSDEKL